MIARILRTLWYHVVLAISTPIHATAVIVAALFRVRHRLGGVYDWGANDWSRQILGAAGTPVRVHGRDRIPTGPVVYASNHSSMFDIWALFATLPGSVRFVAKAELGRVPFAGPAMVRAGHILIDRENKKKALEGYDRMRESIRRGFSAVVFPEGTRSRTGDLLPFKNAPFGLAIAAQVPLVPLYVHHTFGILPKGHWLLRPRPIELYVAPPIPTAGLAAADREALRERVRAAIEDLQRQARVDGRAGAG